MQQVHQVVLIANPIDEDVGQIVLLDASVDSPRPSRITTIAIDRHRQATLQDGVQPFGDRAGRILAERDVHRGAMALGAIRQQADAKLRLSGSGRTGQGVDAQVERKRSVIGQVQRLFGR